MPQSINQIWRASLESRHFSFEAHARSQEQAIAALEAGLKIHADQVGIPGDWYKEGHDISTQLIEIGLPYRDGSVIR